MNLHMLHVLGLLFFSIIFYIQIVNGLKCYLQQPSSTPCKDKSKCQDCSVTATGAVCTLARAEADGKETYAQGCSTIGSSEEIGCKAKTIEVFGVKVEGEHCTCETDYCNGSPHGFTSFWVMFLIPATAVIINIVKLL